MTGHIVTRNRQDPFSEFNNVILLQSQGNGGLDKGGEGQENYFSKKFGLEPVCLDIKPDWQKIILIIFCPTTKVVRLLALLLLPFFTNTSADPRRLHTQHTRFWTREKNSRRTEK